MLDSSALSGAASGQVRIRAELSLAEELGVEVQVSSVTLTETLRGHGRDARVHAVLAGIDQKPVTPRLGRAAENCSGVPNEMTPSTRSLLSRPSPSEHESAF